MTAFLEDSGDEAAKLRGLRGCRHGMEEIDHDFAEQIAVGLFRVFQRLDIRKGERKARLLALGQDSPEQVRFATAHLPHNQAGTVQRRVSRFLFDELTEAAKGVLVDRGHVRVGRIPGVADARRGERIVLPEGGKCGLEVHHVFPRQLRAMYNVPSAAVKDWRSSSAVITEGSPPWSSRV